MLLVKPGIGQVFALGIQRRLLLLGLAGAGAGSAMAKTTKDVVPATPDEKCSEDVGIFSREVLAEGRSPDSGSHLKPTRRRIWRMRF